MKFYIKQKVFSLKDNFSVYNDSENTVYTVEGKFFSLKNKLTLKTPSGEDVLYSEKKVFSLRPTYFIYDLNGTQIAKIRQRFSFRPKFDVSIYHDSLTVQGSLFAHSFTVESERGIEASVTKKIISFGDSYEIDIQAPDNQEIYLFLVIVLDQVLHEQQNKRNH
ncbi:MAG: LURP-one-related family protein [Candidatus Izimaplasma sp.]|nr:LURP-one-related family protein [Candidatus Izimaplasma bacterium]